MRDFTWINEMRVPPGSDFPEFTPSREDLEMMDFLLPLYRAYLENPPKLAIVGEGNLSLHAEEPIKRGSVVVEYLGNWEPGSKTASSYRFGPINGLHFRNFAAMAEDGFPNLVPFYLYGVGGLPLRVVFVALEDMEKGEALTFNYGPNHSVKFVERLEYRLDEMIRFFENYRLRDCLEAIRTTHIQKRSALGYDKSLELENLVAKVQYLFQTPSALLLLLERGVLDTAEVRYFWRKPDYRHYLLGVPFTPGPREQLWIDAMDVLTKDGEKVIIFD